MKNDELKDTILAYAKQTSVNEAYLLFNNQVSKSVIYKWLQESKALVYEYTEDQRLRELENLTKCKLTYSRRPNHNRNVLTFQPHFYKKENELYNDPDIKRKLYQNRVKYLAKTNISDKELLRGFKISGIYIGFSHFSPIWFMKFIKDYSISSVYDPCGGWGHRLIGAHSSKINYIYNDVWADSYKGVKDMCAFINADLQKIIIYNNDCTTFTPNEKYECIFTCPPYFNIEQYSKSSFNDIDDYNKFLTNMFNSSIKPSVQIIAIVINNAYKENIIKSIPESFKYIENHILGTTETWSHFNRTGNQNIRKTEELLIFKRCSNKY